MNINLKESTDLIISIFVLKMKQQLVVVAIQVCEIEMICSNEMHLFVLVNERRASFHLGGNDDDLSNDSPPKTSPMSSDTLKRVSPIHDQCISSSFI